MSWDATSLNQHLWESWLPERLWHVNEFPKLGCKRRDEISGYVTEDNSKHLVQWNRNTVGPVWKSMVFSKWKPLFFLTESTLEWNSNLITFTIKFSCKKNCAEYYPCSDILCSLMKANTVSMLIFSTLSQLEGYGQGVPRCVWMPLSHKRRSPDVLSGLQWAEV